MITLNCLCPCLFPKTLEKPENKIMKPNSSMLISSKHAPLELKKMENKVKNITYEEKKFTFHEIMREGI